MTQRSQFGDIHPGEIEAMVKDNVRRMTDKAESQTDEQIAERMAAEDMLSRLWFLSYNERLKYFIEMLRQSRAEGVESRTTVEQLIEARKMRTHCRSWSVDQILDELIALDRKYNGATNDTD